MAPSRTATVKSKHAANKSGIKNSKTSTKKAGNDGIVKNRSEKSKRTQSKGVSLKQTAREKGKGAGLATLKKKRRVYTEKELDIPKLNMITPMGVEKPKGKKKGKVFVDDAVSCPGGAAAFPVVGREGFSGEKEADVCVRRLCRRFCRLSMRRRRARSRAR